jgi:protein-disulfide isomerase
MPFRLPSLRIPTLYAGAVVALLTGAAGLTTSLTTRPAAAFDFSSDERGAVERIVRDYLVSHPEVLVEAMQALESKQQVLKDEQSKSAIAANRDGLYNDAAAPVGGNPKGDVTLVEFFDYQCGYCKAVLDDLNRAVKDDGKVRFIYKEFPILGPASTTAAKAALAARVQGKYVDVHNALMGFRGRLDDAAIYRLAGGAGVDVERLKKDMEAPAVTAAIDANLALAEKMGIHGTPAFVVGDELVPGAVRYDELKRLLGATRKK